MPSTATPAWALIWRRRRNSQRPGRCGRQPEPLAELPARHRDYPPAGPDPDRRQPEQPAQSELHHRLLRQPGPGRRSSGHGGARTYLGSTTVTTFLEGNIPFLFDSTGAIPLRNAITATATDAQGNTSEFALNFINNRPPVAHIAVTAPIDRRSKCRGDERCPSMPRARQTRTGHADLYLVLRRWNDDRRPTARTTYLVAGQYTVLLLAADGFGGLSTDNLIITVKDVQPTIHAGDLVPARPRSPRGSRSRSPARSSTRIRRIAPRCPSTGAMVRP